LDRQLIAVKPSRGAVEGLCQVQGSFQAVLMLIKQQFLCKLAVMESLQRMGMLGPRSFLAQNNI
jgi:hypothetical protein